VLGADGAASGDRDRVEQRAAVVLERTVSRLVASRNARSSRGP
jgi:hypothetical protein